MLIFNCTQAAQDFFTVTKKGEKRSIVTAPPSKTMEDDAQHLQREDGATVRPFQWVLHSVSLRRKNCLIAMEVNTRFCVVITALKKAEQGSYAERFMVALTAQVSAYGQSHGIWNAEEALESVKQAFTDMTEPKFFRRSDRSVQAHVNDVARYLEALVADDPSSLGDDTLNMYCNQYANTTLRKSRRAFPDREYIVPVEEMFVYWQQRYQQASPERVLEIRQQLAASEERQHQLLLEMDNANEPSEDNEVDSGDALVFLDTMLEKYETDTSLENVSSLHGFLTAIVSGPNLIPLSRWLPEVWGGGDQQPSWDDMEEAQHFINIIMQMMSNISRELIENPEAFTAIFMGDDDYTDVYDWCFGYLAGVELDADAWESMPEPVLKQLNYIDINGFMLEPETKRLSSKKMRERADKVIDVAIHLHGYWLKQRSTAKGASTQNEACPCGSGKPYKKCCLH
jgi:uncharacterized protein